MTTTLMIIRRYEKRDIPAISRLYYHTVHTVNARDYTAAQIVAWAPRIYDDTFWMRRFKQYTVFVAEEIHDVVGFAEVGSTGHIDCFYIHHDWQGRGVGTRLLKRLEREARKNRISRMFADVSLTAMPFFRRKGFKIVRKQKKPYRGCVFSQYHMEKRFKR